MEANNDFSKIISTLKVATLIKEERAREDSPKPLQVIIEKPMARVICELCGFY